MSLGSTINPWLVFTLLFLLIWAIVYIFVTTLRKEMLWASVLTAPFGLTEPLFVPEYWSPPSLFNLAAKIGFDIESIIWCFAVGGIGAVLYELVFKVNHITMTSRERHQKRHRFYLTTLLLPIPVFLILFFTSSLNPIYSASISMLFGAIGAWYCRPDLKNKILFGGLLFLSLYFVFFYLFILVYPEIVVMVWNLPAISGILIGGVPLEELLFAITFGMLWSSYYEHITWKKLVRAV